MRVRSTEPGADGLSGVHRLSSGAARFLVPIGSSGAVLRIIDIAARPEVFSRCEEERRFNVWHGKSPLCKNRNIRYSDLGSMKPQYRRMLRGMRAQKEQPTPTAAAAAVWFLYILECCDGSFYTGVTIDIDRRLREHQEGTASRYTRTRRPVVLAYREECGSRALSLARECAVKSLSRRRKEELIAGGNPDFRRPPS